jgi:eukaryotic-like serine/threonine-protein kinase
VGVEKVTGISRRNDVTGSIASLGSQYVLEVKALNCQSGNILAQEQVTAASREKVLDTLGRAASKLRGELGESLTTVRRFDVPLEQATTSSLEALQAFSLGKKAEGEKSSASALPYSLRAIQLDPAFALAYSAAGWDYTGLGELGRAREYHTKAFQLRDHASEREKLSISGDYYLLATGELDKAVLANQQRVEIYPRDYDGYSTLGDAYSYLGQYQKAVEVQRKALLLALPQGNIYNSLVRDTMALQHFDEALQILRAEQAQKLDHGYLHILLYALAFLRSDPKEMEEQQQWFEGKPEENIGLSLVSSTEAYGGHMSRARELIRRAVASAIRADSKESGAISQAMSAHREAAFGNAAVARSTVEAALKLAPKSQGVEIESALALAIVGDTAQAESLSRDLEKRFPVDTQIQAHWLPAIRARLDLNRKEPLLSLKALQSDSSIELGGDPFADSTSCLHPIYLRGEVYLAAGQGQDAATEFQKIIDHSGIVWNCWTGALARLGVARANALQSKTKDGADANAARARALAAYKDFLTLWMDADPDIPILKQAQREYAKLQESVK